MSRHTLFVALLLVSLGALQAHAQNFFWQGGPGEIDIANYTEVTTAVPPVTTPNVSPPVGSPANSVIFLGNTGAVTYTGSGIAYGRLRLGHTNATLPGTATLSVSNGAVLAFINGAAGVANAGIQVGAGQTATLNIDNATVSSSRFIVIGAGSNVGRSGTVNILNGGILTASDGNINLGDGTGTQNGIQGILNLSGATSAININGAGADLVLGPRVANATYTQTDGTLTIHDSIEVAGPTGETAPTAGVGGSVFNVSGGTITTGAGGAGNFFVGRGKSVGATVNISGTATVNVGNRYLMGGSDTPTAPTLPSSIATGSVTNHSGGTLNTDLDIRVADTFISPTSEATYNLSGTGIINTNTTAVVTASNTVIGRQGIGKFIQTGGTANFNSPLHVGNREAATTTTANGLYKISDGDLTVNAAAPTWPLALSIAPNGTGEFRVVGADANINVTGDFAIATTANGNGTLAFELETGELLSQINVVGAATFGLDSIVALDATIASPTQTSYDLFTATTILDNGLDFIGPAGWGFEIVAGGNGQILRAVQGVVQPGVPGDYNDNGSVDAADYVLWKKGGPLENEVSTPGTVDAQDYTEWRSRFGNSGAGTGLGAGNVPEPTTVVTLLLGVAAMAGLRRRSRN